MTGEDDSMVWSFYPASELDQQGTDWDVVNASSANLPISDSTFFRLLLDEFGTGREILAICREGSIPIAAGIFGPSKWGVWHTFQPSQAPLGAWVQRPDMPIEKLSKELGSVFPRFWLLLGWTQLDPDIVEKPRSKEGPGLVEHIPTARLSISGSPDAYWANRGKNLRKNLKRQRNRLQRESIETHIERVTATEQVVEAVDDYGVVESKGWKAKQGTAIHPSNSQGRFYRRLLETYASRNEGSVYRYFYNDQLVASDICLSRKGVVVLLKTTYDEEQTTTSPSLLMREEILEEYFREKSFDRVEFYGRVMEWHKKWTDEFRQLYHLNVFRWAALESLWRRFRTSRVSSEG